MKIKLVFTRTICFIDKTIFNINDSFYLKCKYYNFTNKKLNLDNPQTFNEKLQWLKLHDRKDIYTTMVDKYLVKDYVKNIIGEEYIIPTIGVYDKFDDINFDELPNQFVIKCTHDSGGLVICKNKDNFDISNARKKLSKSLKRNFYKVGREWPYKNVKPRIIIEQYMYEKNKDELSDYKLFCFNGKPKFTLVCSERFSSDNMCETFFDNNWNLINVTENNHRIDRKIKKPNNFEKMKRFATKLAKNIPFVRIDFYEINGKLYFGEITFYPSAGYEKFEPDSWNYDFGKLINLEGVKNEKEKNN